ncbi:LysR family transcriptional regulator [Thalassospira profundimaris]|uniref:LysR family transcriptional regulator n=1 Tax=Thalassospira profundimaris TaxID=502049 RepID=UPI00215D7614|nr:LysR family transcriptional regulator [Thalassospira profundimaris]
MKTPDWDGLRTFVVLCRAGTMSAAARELGINQTTVSRRLARLEEALGHDVLNREDGHLSPTVQGQHLLATAAAMEQNLAAYLDSLPVLADGIDKTAPSGVVRLSAVDAILDGLLVPAFADFHLNYPAVQLDLTGENRNLNIAQRETDIAIRLALPESGVFRSRRIGFMRFAIYAPRMDMDVQRANWVELAEGLSDKPEQQWLQYVFGPRTIIGRANRATLLAGMAQAGDACCLLPVCIGDRVAGLHRLTQYDVSAGREVWLLVHQDMVHLPHIRVVMDWVADIMKQSGVV